MFSLFFKFIVFNWIAVIVFYILAIKLMIDCFLFKTDFEKLADKNCICFLTIFAFKKEYHLTIVISITFKKIETIQELEI